MRPRAARSTSFSGFGPATQKTKKQIRPNPASIVAHPKAARLHKLVEKIDVAPHQLQPRPRSHRTVHALWRPTDVYLCICQILWLRRQWQRTAAMENGMTRGGVTGNRVGHRDATKNEKPPPPNAALLLATFSDYVRQRVFTRGWVFTASEGALKNNRTTHYLSILRKYFCGIPSFITIWVNNFDIIYKIIDFIILYFNPMKIVF